METPSYIALARMSALRRQMEVVANNVANVNTTGFRGQQMQFVEYLERASPTERYSMPIDLVTTRDPRPGPVQPTGNPLDVALQTEGYFVVQTLGGDRYTRGGSFRLDADRRLVDTNGLPVLGEGGQPIVVPPQAAQISISPQGEVSTELGAVGRIQVVRFENDQLLDEVGNGLYATEQDPIPAEEARMAQGMLEGSNVQSVLEMTRMIEVLRQYQSIQRIVDSEHERQRTMIRQLPRLASA
jgi:flagellar basal-body rod protein FlgF